MEKRNRVRKGIIPGNSASLWKVVNIAKDLGVSVVPDHFHLKVVVAGDGLIPDTFAHFFESKVRSLTNDASIGAGVYNGRKKVNCQDKMFMSQCDVRECILSIKVKNCQGFDRISQRILVDGIDHLVLPLTHLFNEIYYKNQLPDQ